MDGAERTNRQQNNRKLHTHRISIFLIFCLRRWIVSFLFIQRRRRTTNKNTRIDYEFTWQCFASIYGSQPYLHNTLLSSSSSFTFMLVFLFTFSSERSKRSCGYDWWIWGLALKSLHQNQIDCTEKSDKNDGSFWFHENNRCTVPYNVVNSNAVTVSDFENVHNLDHRFHCITHSSD